MFTESLQRSPFSPVRRTDQGEALYRLRTGAASSIYCCRRSSICGRGLSTFFSRPRSPLQLVLHLTLVLHLNRLPTLEGISFLYPKIVHQVFSKFINIRSYIFIIRSLFCTFKTDKSM